jgi:hypothetical protein
LVGSGNNWMELKQIQKLKIRPFPVNNTNALRECIITIAATILIKTLILPTISDMCTNMMHPPKR